MKKQTSLLLLIGIFFAAAIVAFCTKEVRGVEEVTNDSPLMRADVITIDALKSFGDLEQPPVVFLHDLHTDAVEKQNKDCSACHLSEENRQSPKFKRLKDTNKQEVMDIYHGNCQQCHKETAKARVKSGPVEVCGQCHRGKPKAVSDKELIVFDKSLHYRHTEAAKDTCEKCHHQYDEVAKKLFYAKGKEGSCVYCHKQQTEENRISKRLASHLSCIQCHRETVAKKKTMAQARDEKAGPIKCSGCHAEQQLQLIKRIEDVPRMKRNQPDAVLIQAIKTDVEIPKTAPTILMNPVPFDHKSHEKYSNTCRVCHHADLNTCSSCHTVGGKKEGNYVRSEQAMHQLDSERSCLGCHGSRQSKPSCAGCHASIPVERKQQTSYCVHCHAKPPQGSIANPKPEQVASMMLKSRTATTDTYRDEDIPETITIKDLSDQYEPVYFPHRKIVRRLETEIKNDKLAQYFHSQKGTICQACHHNSPATKKPPRCYSCHGKPFNEKELLRPGMKGAYHQQCFGCHKQMGIMKPDSLKCEECHRKRRTS
jgi:hypothetical protein